MIVIESILVIILSQVPPGVPTHGVLRGVVERQSDGQRMPGAEVVLFVRQGKEFQPVAKTVADEQGEFRFQELPVTWDVVYKLGASWAGVHYPGAVNRLTPSRSALDVRLAVNDAISEPNILIAHRHEMTLRVEAGMLKVSEILEIENPTTDCYVGKASEEGAEPETLCLHIPSDFEQVTFDEEFYGRRFSLVDGRLVTSIPWTPGREELRFTYTIPNQRRHRTWTRRLDLPCSELTVRVVTEDREHVACSLGSPAEQAEAIVYHESGKKYAAGHEIRVELGRLPIRPITYAKWVAALVVTGIVGGRVVSTRRRKRPNGKHSGVKRQQRKTERRPRGKRPSVGTRRA